MPLFFLLNNIHFSLEILGALVFLIVAWLAFDAFIIRRDFLTVSRVKAVFLLPALTALRQPFNIVATIGFSLITFISFRQYKREFKKSLLPFWIAFLFLTLGSLTSVFYTSDSLSTVWIIGHLLELVGFFALASWVWSYLQLRIREELLLIFISFALLMAVMVSLTFSTILISRMETQTKDNLLTDARVLDLAILKLQEEALAKAKLLATRTDIKELLKENNFIELEKLSNNLLQEEKLGFLIILDKEGYVVLRAHALTKKDDNLSNERAVEKALAGEKPS